jgi:chloramphenicol O-acetyltransferase type B
MRMHILLKRLLIKLGLREPLTTQDWYPQYEIGVGTYGRPEVVTFGEGTILKMGAYCSIAPGVTIYLGGEHRTDWVTTFPFNILWDAGKKITGHPISRGDVVIGNDVWIGRDAMIMSGVSIGDGAVIGARSLVTKSVSPYSIAGGNPAKEILKRFDSATVTRLLALKWWEWDREKIESFLPLLLSPEIEAFLAAAEKVTSPVANSVQHE